MISVVQRVSKSGVSINNELKGEINIGLMILVGIEETDGAEDIEWLSAKIANLRIFNDNEGVMNLSVKDINGDILLVSQFTLHASTKKGNRPSYIKAARPELAIPIYKKFIEALELNLGKKIQTGEFGSDMQVEIHNDGPVTILIDSKNRV
jgi:D-tyrosyl-tRNA(Tyr) deacylase